MRSKQYDILVVDDDQEDRMIMGEAFSELNCHDRVTMYDSGSAFHQDLMELKTLSPLPLLIVLDYNLPGSDGAVILSLLKNDAVLRTIPVVMYSTGMSNTQRQDCLLKGAVTCFEKGVTYQEVRSFCKQVCGVAFGKSTGVTK